MEFVVNFSGKDVDEITPIDIVAEITGLTYDEIRKCSEIKMINTDDWGE